MLSVRDALSCTRVRQTLRGKIPKECIETPNNLLEKSIQYPLAFMKFFKKEEQYIRLGYVAEELLRYPVDEITPMLLHKLSKIELPAKTLALKSTMQFLEDIKETKKLIDIITCNDEIQYNTTIHGENIQGNPNMRTDKEIFEIKTSGRIKNNWIEYLMQIFAYAALDSTVNIVHIVFPLQQSIWTFSLLEWNIKKREAYRNAIENSNKVMEVQITINDYRNTIAFQQQYGIGYHAQKQKTLVDTVNSLIARSPYVPYQIFITGPTNFQFKDIPNNDLVETLALIQSSKLQLYIHAPYIINLCDINAFKTYLPNLQKHLHIGNIIGAKGIVVHVGKSCKQDKSIAFLNMKNALLEILRDIPYNTNCPLLLETPAGQGTEMLTDMKEFMTFASDIKKELGSNSASFGICIDTCHVFATGICPATYIRYVIDHENSSLLKLIHFNDSKTVIGACVDRHAVLLTGHIGNNVLTTCAILGIEAGVPMLSE